jgi:ATP-binding cassette subfamily C (CFTR/MRP) protein 1
MLKGILRSPVGFFNSTPSGVLINRLSNDLNILDSSLPEAFIDSLECFIGISLAIVNACQIYVYLIPAVVIVVIIGIFFFIFSRRAIV